MSILYWILWIGIRTAALIVQVQQNWDTSKVVEDWDIMNMKVARNIILHISDTIHVKISELKTVKEMWELLRTECSIPGVMIAFLLFKSILDLCIPSDQHPRKAFDQPQMYFVELKEIMLLLMKLSPNMKVVV